MVVYSCSRCNYITNSKTRFRNHLNRKYPCQELFSKEGILEIKEKYDIFDKKSTQSHPKVIPKSSPSQQLFSKISHPKVIPESSLESSQSHPKVIPKYYCEYCDQEFSFKQTKYRHQKKSCKLKKKQSLIKFQETELELLKTQNELLQSKITNITNNSHNTTNSHNKTLNQNITINNFGKENLDYITYKDIKKHLGYGPYGAIRRLIKMVHYNKKHPENHNIAITNKKSKYGSIKKDDVWQLISIKDMLNNLIETKFEMITEAYHSDIKEEVDGFKQSKYEQFFEKFEYDEEQVRKYLDDKIHLMLMNCTKLFKIKPK